MNGDIAGLVTSNDVSERTFQRGDAGGQWTKGKSCEAFNPVGPWLMPVQAEGDIHLRLRSWVSFPYLQEGDIVEIEVERLGRQRQEMVASSPDSGQG